MRLRFDAHVFALNAENTAIGYGLFSLHRRFVNLSFSSSDFTNLVDFLRHTVSELVCVRVWKFLFTCTKRGDYQMAM